MAKEGASRKERIHYEAEGQCALNRNGTFQKECQHCMNNIARSAYEPRPAHKNLKQKKLAREASRYPE